jgi:signal peptidase I
MNLRWLFSGAVRQASDMCKHVEKLLNAQRDILSAQAVEALTVALANTRAAINSGAGKEDLEKQMAALEEAANKWIRPYPNSELRENIEVFLVAIVVAMAIRTFFLQPFKIPTGSMEPTLYGIECTDLRDDPSFKMPGTLERVWDVLFYGTIYHQVIAPASGHVEQVGPLQHIFKFINKQTFYVRYDGQDSLTPITIYCGPDERFANNTGLDMRANFDKGQPIIEFKETTGDHLFVDRITYNFRHPQRGDIVVFKTKGIEGIPNQDQFYIKRLMGLPGETVSIGNDRHARINGQRLDSSTPHLANLYGFDPNAPIRDGKYGGYNGHILQDRPDSQIRTPSDSITVRPKHFLVFGDNTYNSLDSRFWGDLPEQNVIGKSFFVYWPFSKRFGWGQE